MAATSTTAAEYAANFLEHAIVVEFLAAVFAIAIAFLEFAVIEEEAAGEIWRITAWSNAFHYTSLRKWFIKNLRLDLAIVFWQGGLRREKWGRLVTLWKATLLGAGSQTWRYRRGTTLAKSMETTDTILESE